MNNNCVCVKNKCCCTNPLNKERCAYLIILLGASLFAYYLIIIKLI